ncbi:TAF1 transcription initiation factor TFIID subunit TAF1 [Coniophora puteana RWD-64-598 SS2]|uniref:TAF1 transcription initiation factor TFIID subunit TAF1 n=1 Tax=Coniophora puteana (strain RWD-64-598) TaxID=741705 RepID=A0A5M3N755_CONPW|nr:TAF1 transcription initiation factor TFIID subunit TAF1 [Coniophora puteana RWD-64-598 SS2]EIW86914.1 TAF1 transcription initiation factor TFIID subunit TAF1 [Coniophora puteana RWD-64-598 SS2]
MAHQEENDVISTLTGFSLDNVLAGLSLPTGTGRLPSSLGISGLPSLDASQIYSERWDDDDAVGAGEGEDYEDEVDREMQDEDPYESAVKMEVQSPISLRPKQRRTRLVKRLVERPKTVYERFPAFEKDKVLNFSELFKGYTVTKSRLSKRALQAESVYAKKREAPKGFLDAIVGDTRRQVENKRVEAVVSAGSIDNDLLKTLQARENSDVPVTLPLHDRSFDLVLLSNWEDQIVIHPENAFPSHKLEDNNLTMPVNKSLESGAWTQSIIWNPNAPFRDFTQLELDHEEDEYPEERPQETARPRKRFRAEGAPSRDKFNLSNDHFYEVSKDGARHRVRQTFGQLVVEHAYPAQKLQLPFYKTRVSKQEARAFHRPALQFPVNFEIHFTKVRTAKKKKDKAGRKVGKGGNIGEGLRKTNDLTLKDTSNFVLWEYSEEHPPIIQNFGMGSILVNYYRKKDEKDEHIPKLDLGVPFVLEPQDESPFMKFGYVYPGQTFPAVYNNLIRAPLFRHKPYQTDFLCVRSTIRGETRYHLREIKNLFVVGQSYPVTEVPGPHSRKITNTIKHRLQIIAFKLLKKSYEERLKISRLMKYFPDQNELQMRQRLKEFMEYHRRGIHQGFWRLKSGITIPSDADMLKMVGPEQVVLMESMQVGQRHLQDAGYTQTAEQEKDADEEGESKLSVEQQLAPWITTKNFLFATQAKAMLRLHGEGDPTGRGEAFSFIRISMKDIFVKAGEDYEQKLAEAENRPKSAHRYNVAEQQQIYKSEIERIWKAQFDSLSRTDEPELSEEDEPVPDPKKSMQRQPSLKFEGMPYSPAMSPVTPGPMSPSFSRASSVDHDREMSMGPNDSRKVLRIRRLVDDEWQMEIIRDPAVIRAYVRARQLLEEEQTLADNLAPTGDAFKDKRYKKMLEDQIARMKKNQERRLHRKNAKIVKEGGTPMQLDRPLKPDTTRRCGHCGQMGHMKTNRKCPRWAEFNSGATPLPATPASATSPPPGTPMSNMGGFSRQGPSFGFGAAVPSPLATSPPMTAVGEDPLPPTPSGSAPKIKLTLKRT